MQQKYKFKVIQAGTELSGIVVQIQNADFLMLSKENFGFPYNYRVSGQIHLLKVNKKFFDNPDTGLKLGTTDSHSQLKNLPEEQINKLISLVLNYASEMKQIGIYCQLGKQWQDYPYKHNFLTYRFPFIIIPAENRLIQQIVDHNNPLTNQQAGNDSIFDYFSDSFDNNNHDINMIQAPLVYVIPKNTILYSGKTNPLCGEKMKTYFKFIADQQLYSANAQRNSLWFSTQQVASMYTGKNFPKTIQMLKISAQKPIFIYQTGQKYFEFMEQHSKRIAQYHKNQFVDYILQHFRNIGKQFILSPKDQIITTKTFVFFTKTDQIFAQYFPQMQIRQQVASEFARFKNLFSEDYDIIKDATDARFEYMYEMLVKFAFGNHEKFIYDRQNFEQKLFPEQIQIVLWHFLLNYSENNQQSLQFQKCQYGGYGRSSDKFCDEILVLIWRQIFKNIYSENPIMRNITPGFLANRQFENSCWKQIGQTTYFPEELCLIYLYDYFEQNLDFNSHILELSRQDC